MDYKIKRAIILAAGRGMRLRPYTNTCPKPMLKVNNLPIIEHTIKYLMEKCFITDITIVTGYRARQFDYLKTKYGVTLIRNKDFNHGSNLLSLKLAANKIEDCVILDGDIILSGNAIRTSVPCSGYSYVKEKRANEWSIEIDDTGQITNIVADLTEKHDFNALHSISYWVGNAAKVYQDAINVAKDDVNYVDDIAIKLPVKLNAYEIKKSDLIEIDTVEEYENVAKI